MIAAAAQGHTRDRHDFGLVVGAAVAVGRRPTRLVDVALVLVTLGLVPEDLCGAFHIAQRDPFGLTSIAVS